MYTYIYIDTYIDYAYVYIHICVYMLPYIYFQHVNTLKLEDVFAGLASLFRMALSRVPQPQYFRNQNRFFVGSCYKALCINYRGPTKLMVLVLEGRDAMAEGSGCPPQALRGLLGHRPTNDRRSYPVRGQGRPPAVVVEAVVRSISLIVMLTWRVSNRDSHYLRPCGPSCTSRLEDHNAVLSAALAPASVASASQAAGLERPGVGPLPDHHGQQPSEHRAAWVRPDQIGRRFPLPC